MKRRGFIRDLATGLLLPIAARAGIGAGGRLGRLGAAVAGVISSGGGSSFDYYVSPTGDDNNAGTLASPWSITALNNNQSTYAGKRIGFLPGTYQYGTIGGVQTTLYSILQGLANSNVVALNVQAGPSSSQPTYLGSSSVGGLANSNGSCPQTAILDFSNPSGGALPTNEASCLGQAYGYAPPGVSAYGNFTIDGLVIRNFTFAAIMLYGNAPTYLVKNWTIKNCELYNAQNVKSNDNPGAIWLQFCGSASVNGNGLITNCCMHDLQTNAAGTSFNYMHYGITQFFCFGITVTNCTTFNSLGYTSKDSSSGANVSYCYFGFGKSSTGYNGSLTNVGDTVENYQAPSSGSISFHHNILVGPMGSWGESGLANQGSCQIYNNTFYKFGSIGGSNNGLLMWNDIGTVSSGGTGSFDLHDNLVYASDGNYDYGNQQPGALAKIGALLGGTGSTLACDYNAYGSNGVNGMNFGQDYSHDKYTLAAWQALGEGYDPHSINISSSPFSGTPLEPNATNGPGAATTFAITGAALTAGSTGGPVGAVDGSGSIGCNWTPLSGNQ